MGSVAVVSLANHAHVFPQSINPDATIDRLLTLMDACDIERAVAFAPFAKQCDNTDIDPNPWLADQVSRQPRLHAFGTVDTRRLDVADQVKQIADLGFRGIKVHPNAQSLPILSKKAFDLYAAAQRHRLFITFHSGVHQSRMKDSRVVDFDEIAWEFPELRFSLEHVGGYHFFNEALAVIFNHMPTPWNPKEGRVFAGLTSIFTNDYLRFWHQSRQRLLEIVAQVGAGQMIFGLDFPYNLEPQIRTAIQTIRDLGLSIEDQEKILGGNLKRLLGL